MKPVASIGIYDYDREKLCDLYDSQTDLEGQAYSIFYTKDINGVPKLTFKLPYMVDSEKNFRWPYMKSDYLLRLHYAGKNIWFVASKPKKSRSGKEIIGDVECNGTPNLLKTKNIYQLFDDTNGIGTIQYLISQTLKGTGWSVGARTMAMKIYEKDGTTEKIRSLKVNGKSGALQLITTICNLFKCRPEFDTDAQTVDLIPMTEREQVLEGEIGRNLSAIAAQSNSEDIVTRLYVEGEYGEDGYIGIDDVNPTGLNYIMNFDYYKEIGVFKPRHQTALDNYLRDIRNVNERIKENTSKLMEIDGDISELIGQAQMAVYYTSSYTEPVFTYGDPPAGRAKLYADDEVIVVNSDGTYRYDKLGNHPSDVIQAGDFAIVKFVVASTGVFGSKEMALEAKKKLIEELQKKIDNTSSEDKKKEYQEEIEQLEAQIEGLYNGVAPEDRDGKAVRNQLVTSYIPADYKGNAYMTDRIIVPGSRMIAAGYTEFSSDDYATIYSMTYTAGPGSEYDYRYGKRVTIDITPIKKNGTVMSRSQVEEYISIIVTESTSTGRSLLDVDADRQNLLLRVYELGKNESMETALYKSEQWTNSLHLLQAAWDIVRAKYDWFKKTDRDPGGYFEDIRGIRYRGMYELMYSLVKSNGMLSKLKYYQDKVDPLSEEQDDIEATFIVAMGNMLRDGYWQNNNYIVGQEEHLYADAMEMSEQMAKPDTSYTLSYVRLKKEFDIPIEDFEMNAIFRVNDEELDVHDNLFITQIQIGIDDEKAGSITVSNQDLTIQNASLGSILSRMSQLADLIDQKNQVYERAKYISNSGSLYTQRLEGQINVLRTQFLSTVSNWYTDDKGNIVFEAADGTSAMMLCGAGFMIAADRNEDGDWNWRTFGTGH